VDVAAFCERRHTLKLVSFSRHMLGPKNSFLETIRPAINYSSEYAAKMIVSTLQALLSTSKPDYTRDLAGEESPTGCRLRLPRTKRTISWKRKASIPASSCVLIGATLEEFLRTWIEAEGLSLGNRKPSLDSYSQVLRDCRSYY
jgi:hypothetical protein